MVLRPRKFSSRVGVAASSGGSAAGGSMVQHYDGTSHREGQPRLLRLLLRREPWRGEESLRAAISTGWGQWCAAQRHSNAIQRLGGGQPLRCAAATFLWRSGALHSALHGLRLRIRPIKKTRAASPGSMEASPGEV